MVVVFLNCFLRSPGWIFHDKQSQRIPLIPKYTILNKDTIVGLCEVFGNKYCTKLAIEYNKYNYNFAAPQDTSSGLALAYPKNYELISNKFEAYTDSKLPDSLANKGFMHCILKCKDCGTYSNILITHLQCTYSDDAISDRKLRRYEEIQKNQLLQLKYYINHYKINDYILMGDFNINKDRTDRMFMFFMKLFDYQRKTHLLTDTPTFQKTNTIIDYILVNSGKKINKTVTVQPRTAMMKRHPDVNFISDHLAISLI